MNKVVKKLKQELSYKNGRYYFPPDFLSLLVTLKCNFRCQSCSIWENDFGQELDDEAWIGIIEQAKKVLNPNTYIEINGGEPLLKKDLVYKIIKELKSYFKAVVLNSNGSLVTEEVVKKLEESGLSKMKVSLYSLNPTTHNSLRGTEVAYDGAMKTIELVKNSKIRLEIGVLLTAKNIKEIPDLVEYFKDYKNTTLILQVLDEKVESKEAKVDIDNKMPEGLWPEKEDILNFFDWLENNVSAKKLFHERTNFRLIRDYYLDPTMALNYRCFAGQHNCVIYPNGDITLCFKGQIVGNLLQNSLEDILKKGAVAERKKIKNCKKYCRLVGCNFSRGFKEIVKDLF